MKWIVHCSRQGRMELARVMIEIRDCHTSQIENRNAKRWLGHDFRKRRFESGTGGRHVVLRTGSTYFPDGTRLRMSQYMSHDRNHDDRDFKNHWGRLELEIKESLFKLTSTKICATSAKFGHRKRFRQPGMVNTKLKIFFCVDFTFRVLSCQTLTAVTFFRCQVTPGRSEICKRDHSIRSKSMAEEEGLHTHRFQEDPKNQIQPSLFLFARILNGVLQS